MTQRTPLHPQHVELEAKIVDFFGWDMPLHYGSQLQEHNAVREKCGMFDVSHMGIVDITGPEALDALRYVIANDARKLKTPGQALYGCMLNEQGGILDDLIVYCIGNQGYRIVWNASRRDHNLNWLTTKTKSFDIMITERIDLAMIAVQGPLALDVIGALYPQAAHDIMALKPFCAKNIDATWIARTGYTGEDGVEIMLPALDAPALWQALLDHAVTPTGLGARDTLRLEAGLNLYGADMNDTTQPHEANIGWTVDLKDETRDFIGKAAILTQKEKGFVHKLVGIVMTEPGVLRDHQTVLIEGQDDGEITSGSFSPTLGHAIALARVPRDIGTSALIERRGKTIRVKVIKPPFVRHGAKMFD
jgi:aminomethyltransferase